MSLVKKFVEDAQKQDSTQARIQKYSDDQPRDDHGRWAAGGGSDDIKQQEGQYVRDAGGGTHLVYDVRPQSVELHHVTGGGGSVHVSHEQFRERYQPVGRDKADRELSTRLREIHRRNPDI